jgi:NAD(P)-dependent dehydrogenase (short-subunit alcohol dehydrogenase family)
MIKLSHAFERREMPQKVALVTGCSSGFGLLSAVELAKNGFHVVATMRDLARNERLLAAAKQANVEKLIDVRRLDVTDFDYVFSAVPNIIRDYGRIDALVNNAGYALAGFAEDIQLDELHDQLETNFFGQVAMAKAVLPAMRAQRSGHIIMVSSISGLAANPVTSSYSASKFALEGWSEALRIELHSLGIRVVLVEPGAYDTDIWSRNVTLGKTTNTEASLNRDRSRRFSNVVKTKLKKADPMEVAELIVRVANDPDPKLRYLIGRDATLRYWAKRILPWRQYERMVEKMSDIG